MKLLNLILFIPLTVLIGCSEDTTTTTTTAGDSSDVTWTFDGSVWTVSGTAPDCDDPLDLQSPVDLTSVISKLLPGQERGGDYKPHGGLGAGQ